MRRALENELPAFSAVYGLHPWDIERLSMGEIDTYRRHLHTLGRKDKGDARGRA